MTQARNDIARLGEGVYQDRPWVVEGHDITPIPISDRHGKPGDLAPMWIGANINYVVLFTGALPLTLGLSFWDTLSLIVIGNLLGCSVLGLASIMGPRTGTAGIVGSRAPFGHLAALVVTAISTLSVIGWFSINSVVATQSLEVLIEMVGIPPGVLVISFALLFVLIAEIGLAIYGHATIVAAEKWIAAIMAILFIGMLLLTFQTIDFTQISLSTGTQSGSWPLWIASLGVIFSYPMSWTNFASDYSRYLPEYTSWKKIALSAGGGQFLALTFCEIIGAFTAVALNGVMTDPVKDLQVLLPQWYLVPFLIAVILGSIATNVPNGYTAGLGLLALRIPISRITSLFVIAAFTMIFRVVTVVSGEFLGLYQQWLTYITLWTCPWAAIIIVDHFLRKGVYDSSELMSWGRGLYWYRSGIGWPACLAFLLGLAASLVFSNSPTFSSPLMIRYFGGTDLSFEAGLLFAGASYYALAKRCTRSKAT